jgi:hypothetical protein
MKIYTQFVVNDEFESEWSSDVITALDTYQVPRIDCSGTIGDSWSSYELRS